MQSWNLTSSTTVQVQVLNFHTDLHLPAMMFVCVCVCVNVCVCVSVCVCVCVLTVINSCFGLHLDATFLRTILKSLMKDSLIID